MSKAPPTPLDIVHAYHDPHKRNGGTAGHGDDRHMRALYADDRQRNGVKRLRKGQQASAIRMDEVRITNVKTGAKRTMQTPCTKKSGTRWRDTMWQIVTGKADANQPTDDHA